MRQSDPIPQTLIETAERLVRAGKRLTMEALATASGLSRATVYRQAGSHAALLAQLSARGVDAGEGRDYRSRILRAAGQIFARQGFETATMESIAEAAEVGSATVYRHFGDKRRLVVAFLAAHAPRQAVWRLARRPTGDLRADLERLVLTILQRAAAQPELLRIAFVERMRGGSLLHELSAGRDRTIHGVTALLRSYAQRGELAAEDPNHLARALLGMIFGFGMMGALLGLPQEGAAEPTARVIVNLFLHGAKRRVGRRAPSPTRQKRRAR